MRKFKAIFDFYINSSIHVALAVVSLCLVTYFNFGLSPSSDLLWFLFFGTVTGYNFVKYAPIAKLHHQSLAKRLKLIQLFSFVSFVFLLWFAFQLQIEVLLWTGFFGLFTLLYAMPVLSRKRNLRSISGLKIFIIALVWAGVSVILPTRSGGFSLSLDVLVEFFQRFLFILVLILPFEIRDLKYDLEKLGTVPQKVGVTSTKILGVSLLVVMVLLEFLKSGPSKAEWGGLAFAVIITARFVWEAREQQSKYYASFWVEAIPIWWVLMLLLIRSL